MFYITIKKEGIKKVLKATENNLLYKINEARFFGYQVIDIFQDFNQPEISGPLMQPQPVRSPGKCRREEQKRQGLEFPLCLTMNFENLGLETEWKKGYNVFNKRADDQNTPSRR